MIDGFGSQNCSVVGRIEGIYLAGQAQDSPIPAPHTKATTVA